mmetsp:Transcript_15603/g.36834  ORF Transcript_15603/g.36834 Transcript_15603/m.36834 type:complete len:204 (+) Transcript_15603:1755-2366(+)
MKSKPTGLSMLRARRMMMCCETCLATRTRRRMRLWTLMTTRRKSWTRRPSDPRTEPTRAERRPVRRTSRELRPGRELSASQDFMTDQQIILQVKEARTSSPVRRTSRELRTVPTGQDRRAAPRGRRAVPTGQDLRAVPTGLRFPTGQDLRVARVIAAGRPGPGILRSGTSPGMETASLARSARAMMARAEPTATARTSSRKGH